MTITVGKTDSVGPDGMVVAVSVGSAVAVAKAPLYENGAPKERIEPVPKELENVGIDEKLGSQVPLNSALSRRATASRVGLAEIVVGQAARHPDVQLLRLPHALQPAAGRLRRYAQAAST